MRGDAAEARLDRLESQEAIRQLVARYALAADMCDLDALVGLYVDDVEAGRGLVGRAPLRDMFGKMLGMFEATIHLVANHVIDLAGPDSAEGNVYMIVHHEMQGAWVTAQGMYHDRYERQGGAWLFRQRTPILAYAVQPGVSPVGEGKVRWPGQPPAEGSMHFYGPSWAAFHGIERGQDDGGAAQGEGFIARIRAGTKLPIRIGPRR